MVSDGRDWKLYTFFNKVFLGNEPCQYGVSIPCFGDHHHLPSSGVDVIVFLRHTVFVWQSMLLADSAYITGETKHYRLHDCTHWSLNFMHWVTQNHTLWYKHDVQPWRSSQQPLMMQTKSLKHQEKSKGTIFLVLNKLFTTPRRCIGEWR